MPDCLFCRIARKEIPARIVDEDADTLTFEDIEPQAPVHLLVIPGRHIATGNEVTEGDDALLGKLLRAAARAARAMGFAENGRHMGWPPG
jgi:histidine triad (HIT) family protein